MQDRKKRFCCKVLVHVNLSQLKLSRYTLVFHIQNKGVSVTESRSWHSHLQKKDVLYQGLMFPFFEKTNIIFSFYTYKFAQ